MKALLNFGMIAESTDLHEQLERLIKAEHSVQGLLSVEQQQALEKTNTLQLNLQDLFPDFFGKKDEVHQKTLSEWRDVKFFKH